MTVLCCGDREWHNHRLVYQHLRPLGPGTVIVHGDCRGADRMCASWAEQFGYVVKSYPADWTHHGRRAGPLRNQAMLDAHPELELVIAFHNRIETSKGTADMLHRALRAGIPCRLVSSVPGRSVYSYQPQPKLL